MRNVFVLLHGSAARGLLGAILAVWRVVHGAGLFYFGILVFLLSQTEKGVSNALGVDDRVGLPTEPITYGRDCRVYVPYDAAAHGAIRPLTILSSTSSTA